MTGNSATSPLPTVVLRPGRLEVRNHTSEDATLVAAAERAVADGEDLQAWFQRILQVGALALASTRTSHDLQNLERVLAALTGSVEKTVSESMARLAHAVDLAVAEDSTFAKAQDAAITRLATGVASLLTGSQAVIPNQLSRAVQDVTGTFAEQMRTDLQRHAGEIRRVIDSDRHAAATLTQQALAGQIEQVRTTVEALRTSLVANQAASVAAAAERSRSNRPGFDYETAALQALTRLSAAAGDEPVQTTGGTPGLDGSKIGDGLVTFALPGGPRLAIEAKLRTTRALDARAWGTLLTQARKARGAACALGMTTPDLMPNGQRVLVLSPHDFVIGWDPDENDDSLLLAVYRLLRVAASTADGSGAGLDAALVRTRLAELAGLLQPLESIQTQVATGRKALEKIRELAATLNEDLQRRLTTLQQELASEPSASAPSEVMRLASA